MSQSNFQKIQDNNKCNYQRISSYYNQTKQWWKKNIEIVMDFLFVMKISKNKLIPHSFTRTSCWFDPCSVKYCIQTRIIIYNVTSEYDTVFVLLILRLQLRILEMTKIHQWRKMYFSTFIPCFIDHFFLVSEFCQLPCRYFLQFFPFSTASSYCHRFVGIDNLPILLQVFPRQFTVFYKALLLASEFPTFHERFSWYV